ncbi:hypothetical protein [Nannocystis radixulma]|uniref:Uncharacterized protein n=1 Tax=Nannocystis radixulma TaxID=2995305 RepID=A0ABT5B5D3_9BACT|nr:hypothetical protein [Nannocystis radixulma]MDC0669296.1 hypothetical protein [Nannocystis radixulma]
MGLPLQVLGCVIVWAITIPFVVAAVRSVRNGEPLRFSVRALYSHEVRTSVGPVGAAIIGLAALGIAVSFAVGLLEATGVIGDKLERERCEQRGYAAFIAWNDHVEALRKELAALAPDDARREGLRADISALVRVGGEVREHPERAEQIAGGAPVADAPAYHRAMQASRAAQEACQGHGR